MRKDRSTFKASENVNAGERHYIDVRPGDQLVNWATGYALKTTDRSKPDETLYKGEITTVIAVDRDEPNRFGPHTTPAALVFTAQGMKLGWIAFWRFDNPDLEVNGIKGKFHDPAS